MSVINRTTQAVLRSQAHAGLTVDTAVRAADDYKNIDVMIDVAVNLGMYVVDVLFPSGHQPFGPQLAQILVTYRIYVWATYALSLAIAKYGERFDNEIIKLCADGSLTVEQRRRKIDEFIRAADAIHTMAKEIMTDLDNLQDEFNTFIASFRAWIDGVQSLGDVVSELNKSLDQLESDITSTRNAAAANIVGSSASMVNLSVHAENELKNMTSVDAINSLGQLWQAVSNDALEIELWLKDGAKDADIPEYMKLSLDHAVAVYADMAVALRAYATTLTEKDIPRP
ncbi:hypothetical protein EVJ58_g4895 [Rhodofomes roseus]|uniref:Uncharacterized protein n=1 Tax=Rhodofomes roseus TaxID=34475 RepID=A0A4Y9YER6_9APHY|nr:hypothetical protein EVJ58_g4895 [Rhodofomes roseus]